MLKLATRPTGRQFFDPVAARHAQFQSQEPLPSHSAPVALFPPGDTRHLNAGPVHRLQRVAINHPPLYLVANETVCDHLAPDTSSPVNTNTSTAGSGFH
jgi:hypothetical protein